jgi:regulator of replication initiation timing
LKVNQGRIIRTEQQLGRIEKRIERVEKQNAHLKAELSKLRARVDQNTKNSKQHASSIAGLMGLTAPVQALVRSFKQTPGAPFTAWRMWMLSTFRKQGLYRKRMFG